jgi:hypothetical protein
VPREKVIVGKCKHLGDDSFIGALVEDEGGAFMVAWQAR